jgi:hypothetical protein
VPLMAPLMEEAGRREAAAGALPAPQAPVMVLHLHSLLLSSMAGGCAYAVIWVGG